MTSNIPLERSGNLCAARNPAERQAMIWTAPLSAKLRWAIDGGGDDWENVAGMGGQ